MPTKHIDGEGKVSWELLIIIVTFSAAVAWFSIDIGGVKRQVDVNTTRLDRFEVHATQTRELEAKIDARLAVIEAQILQHLREGK